ncbi:MAG TPA: PQQ-binding-like beta-propeller repeat protein [Bryobacteraceae bacterium]|nr:PQQ-binding-like beta-propeller repeat protein [Bryobacteraceae bacterium]
MSTVVALAQTDWPVYGHDPGGSRFSPLNQITTANVASLRRAWTYHSGETGAQFETTPIVVSGMMYLSTPRNRMVALEPETGKQIWSFDPKIARPREHRGVAYWPGDAHRSARIVFGTGDGRLIALDAKTGKPIPEFGEGGEVNLRAGVADLFPGATYSITSPPAVYRDLIIVGPNTQEGPSLGPSGDARAFDARTGKPVWRFHTVPQPGQPGSETWGADGWKDRSGPSLWGPINLDVERGLVFLATGNPADSFYGADRKGSNLYANCVIALDAATGQLRWFYQIVHHDIFDYDVPGNPTLIEAVQDGRRIPAIAQITKMGLLFILDRMTGKPVFGVEERNVPRSDVPGEEAWPTQPFPLRPPPLARVSVRREELAHRTPEAERYCRELFDQLQGGSVFTPNGMKKTLIFPGLMGGGNWGGVSFDPKLGYVFVNTSSMGGIGRMVPAPLGSVLPYRNETAYTRFLDPGGYPCQEPPWGELTAVNTATGDIVWRVPLGNFDELQSQGMEKTGTPNVGGSVATGGGLVFIAATNDARLRAFDSRTGKELWVGRLDATGNATPITFQGRDGQQYVVIAAGGPDHLRNVGDNSTNRADTIIAFSLGGTAQEATPMIARSTASAAPTEDLPDAPGKAVVLRVCTKCHGTGAFAQNRMSRDEWRSEVNSMVARGATGTRQDLRTVVNYLAKHLAPPKDAGKK